MAQKNYLTDADFDDAGPLKPVKTSAIERVGDLGLSALKGAVAIPEAVVGLADLATGGRAGKAAEGLGLRFKDAKQALDEKKSVAAQLADRRFNEAEGFGGKLGAAIENPSLIANAIAESVPLMGGGAVVGRGIAGLAPKLGSAGAAAAGEGIVGAGSAAEAIRQETTNGELTGKQALLAGGTGLATGLIGAGGARAAKALGVGDIDTALVKGTTDIAGEAGKKAPGMLSSVGRGALAEGVLEELPQSMAEQSLQNVALDRPWEQDLDAAAAMGLVTGGAMGGGMGLMGRQTTPPAPQPQPAPAQPPVTPAGPTQALGLPAPVVTVDSAGRAMTADDRNARQQKWANGDVTDVTPIRETPAAEKLQFPGGAAPAPVLEPVAKPSEQMGLNPSAGPLSAAAVTAVDGDATPSMQAAAQATAQQEQATQSQQQADNKVKSSGWSMNEFPVGDYPMVATFDDKEQPLFMFQSGNEFDVLDANEKVVARGNSFEEAAGKAKLYKTGLTKATAPALEQVAASNQPATPPAAPITTQGATNGTQADQAQQAETQRQEAPAATGLKP
ncbi:MAG: hypothetical protein RLZ68_1129, partial [Pseudomonadota bacterium]